MSTTKSEGKTGFLKEYFVDHPDAEKTAIDDAWQQAGNEGTISPSLIYKVRTDLGQIGKRRTKAKAKKGAGAGGRSSAAPDSEARRSGLTAGDREASETNGEWATTGVAPPARSRAVGDDRTRILIALEADLDQMIHEIKLAGGLPEFEEALRRARRILVRSHEG